MATIIPIAIGTVVSLTASFGNSNQYCASVIIDLTFTIVWGLRK
jgi:hypothetical protein